MKKSMLAIMAVSLLCLSLDAYGLTASQKVHSCILGSQDASPESAQLVRLALQAAGIEDAQNVPVKIMNRIGAIITTDTVLCLTAGCVWVNEEQVKDLSDEEKVFRYWSNMIACQAHNPNKYVLANILVPACIGIAALAAYENNVSPYVIVAGAGLSVLVYSAIETFA